MMNVKAKVDQLFSVPLVTAQLPLELQCELEEYYAPHIPDGLLNDDPAAENANDFFSDQNYDTHPQLQEIILELSKKMLVEELFTRPSFAIDVKTIHISSLWIQNYLEGHYHSVHAHSGALLAGTYMLKSNGLGQPLILNNPDDAGPYITGAKETYLLPPIKGNLYLFPAWIRHHVLPSFEQDIVRSVIAFAVLAERTYFKEKDL